MKRTMRNKPSICNIVTACLIMSDFPVYIFSRLWLSPGAHMFIVGAFDDGQRLVCDHTMPQTTNCDAHFPLFNKSGSSGWCRREF